MVHSPTSPFAQALLIDDGVIAWIGDDDTADGLAARADRVVDLEGDLIAPAFVDAHVHLLETGLARTGLDLSAGGAPTLADALGAVRSRARSGPGGVPAILGHGWDELTWPERRPPTRQELDAAAGGAPVYLSRVDLHSAVVSTRLAEQAGLTSLAGWHDDGRVVGDAHHAARDVARAVSAARHEELCRSVLRDLAAAGIASVHEHSAPHVDTREGLARLLRITADPDSGLPLVIGYRGEACRDVGDVQELREQIPGLTGLGGDLSVDGSLGSRTAALREPYADADSTGVCHLSEEQVARHVAAAARAGMPSGFHAIGDRALDVVLSGVAAAAEDVGEAAVRAAGLRLEHAELVDDESLRLLVRWGAVLSVQPGFDRAWGGPDGLYARRLGVERAARTNRLAAYAAAGIPCAFGSDSPVTPADPWEAVRAAAWLHEPAERISVRAAFRAHTRGGWRLAGIDGSGQLTVGAPAHLAVWRTRHLSVHGGAPATGSWSADPRAGSPLLPDLSDPAEPIRCLQTVRAGVILHDLLADG